MPYIINTNQFYKIWFSKNPHLPLGIENELALVRLRSKHPTAEIALVYSSECLLESAQATLKAFTQKHQIQLVDFDTDIEKNITDTVLHGTEADRMAYILEPLLYMKAKQEIQKTIQNKGGNLAAASDITRLLEPIAKLGIYSDFDVELNFSSFSHKLISVKTPIVFAAEATIAATSMNNEFFAIAKTQDNAIVPQAREQLSKLKAKIILNYAHPATALLETLFLGQDSLFISNHLAYVTMAHFFQTHPKATIFEFRQYLEQLTLSKMFSILDPEVSAAILECPYSATLSEKQLYNLFGKSIKKYLLKIPTKSFETKMQEVPQPEPGDQEVGRQSFLSTQHQLYTLCVRNITGPITLKALIDNIDNIQLIYASKAQIASYSLEKNGLNTGVSSPNNIQSLAQHLSNGKNFFDIIGSCGHQSWTSLGACKKKLRELRMRSAVPIIQTVWKQHKAHSPTTIHTSPIHSKAEKLGK